MNDLDRIIKFLIENRWQYKFPLTRETQLQRDLKIWGDDADEILIRFSSEFGVDISRFPTGEYFDDEGDQTFKGIYGLFSKRRRRPKKILTIGDLEKAIFAGRLDEEVINSTYKEKLDIFLRSKGFVLSSTKHYPDFFDDFFEIWKSDLFNIRFVQDRLQQSIDISHLSNEDTNEDNWYDLSLVKALLTKQTKLNVPVPISEHSTFLIHDFHQIEGLFGTNSYPATKAKLDNLRNLRMKQMFGIDLGR